MDMTAHPLPGPGPAEQERLDKLDERFGGVAAERAGPQPPPEEAGDKRTHHQPLPEEAGEERAGRHEGQPVIVAVDGGGSKTDAVAVTLAGDVVRTARGPGSSPQAEGLDASVQLVDRLVREVAGGAPVARVGLYLSGLDLPREIADYRAAVSGRAWARGGLDVDNDLFALLRAGTDERDAVAVVCGTGMNAVGVRADGETVRFLAVGAISGDWGGGYGLGLEALWHAARDVDGRGPHTLLTAAVETEFGLPVAELSEQLHVGDRSHADLARLAPVVFAAAEAGDDVARALVDRQADEAVTFVRACVTRLDLAAAPVPVVLGGSIFQAGHAAMDARIAAGVAEVSPAARLVTLTRPPVEGAVLLTLERARVAENGDRSLSHSP
nr:BadF/BadG/BcrA/BcrD ATPase family protein [Propionicimonas sp.]